MHKFSAVSKAYNIHKNGSVRVMKLYSPAEGVLSCILHPYSLPFKSKQTMWDF